MALHQAAAADLAEIIIPLLTSQDGSYVDAVDSDGRSPLCYAAREGAIEATRVLLSLGASPACSDADAWTPLCHAARFGHSDIVQLLLDSLPADATLEPALKLAVKHGHVRCASLLLQRCELRESLAESMAATRLLDAEMRELLQQHTHATYACSGFMDACFFRYVSTENKVEGGWLIPALQVLWPDLLPGRELTGAAQHDDAARVLRILSDGACLRNVHSTDAKTALLAAAAYGCLASMCALLDHGVPMDSATADGLTALMAACREGRSACVAELLNRGVNAAIRDAQGWTALCYASRYGFEDAVSVMLAHAQDYSADVRAADATVALSVSARFRANAAHGHIVRLLLDAGADVYARNALGFPIPCFGSSLRARCVRGELRAFAQVVHQYERRLQLVAGFPHDVLRIIARLAFGPPSACAACGLMADDETA